MAEAGGLMVEKHGYMAEEDSYMAEMDSYMAEKDSYTAEKNGYMAAQLQHHIDSVCIGSNLSKLVSMVPGGLSMSRAQLTIPSQKSCALTHWPSVPHRW